MKLIEGLLESHLISRLSRLAQIFDGFHHHLLTGLTLRKSRLLLLSHSLLLGLFLLLSYRRSFFTVFLLLLLS